MKHLFSTACLGMLVGLSAYPVASWRILAAFVLATILVCRLP